VPPYLIAATVIGVLAQRLARTLCPACKTRDETTTRATLDEVTKPWRLSGGVRPYKPVGCLECRHTGFRGRAGLYELMVMTEATGAHVHPALDASALRRQAVKDGMRPLRLAGAMKVAEGVTTVEEVLRSTPVFQA
jgi:general secretion pathway protein E